jgi:ubiquinone/menaquinone biosynthesis C-methylase UbiE
MLEAVALRPGERVLELACGDGEVGLRAAEAVGADGVVVCSGFAEPMTEVVAERAAARQLTAGHHPRARRRGPGPRE